MQLLVGPHVADRHLVLSQGARLVAAPCVEGVVGAVSATSNGQVLAASPVLPCAATGNNVPLLQ